MNTETTARLLISCDDKPSIVATVSNFLYRHGANITALDQLYRTTKTHGHTGVQTGYRTVVFAEW